MKNYIIIFLFLITSCAPKPLEFHRVFPETDKGEEYDFNGNKNLRYVFYFIVSNYENSRQSESKIDSFAQDFFERKEFEKNTGVIWIYFKKETRRTNLKEIEKWPRGFFLNSLPNDNIFTYRYFLEGLQEKIKYKKGKEVESWPAKEKSKVKFTIIPVPDSSYN